MFLDRYDDLFESRVGIGEVWNDWSQQGAGVHVVLNQCTDGFKAFERRGRGRFETSPDSFVEGVDADVD